MRSLIVEDDAELSEILEKGLREQGIQADRAATFDAGRDAALHGAHDVIVLDVMLPGGDGIALCGLLRERGLMTPILMLTARDAVDDRVKGLEAGADDYLAKPFAFPELVARLRALARRPPTVAPDILRVADLEVDAGRREARRADRAIPLTTKEFALLECLARRAGQVVDRAAITAYVWDENHDPFTNVLEVLVRRVRKKIDDGAKEKLIHTVRGAGYRLGA